MKVNKKIYGLLFSIFVSVFMSFFMSFVQVIINIGFTREFFIIWIRAFAVGFLVALPVASISIPAIRKLLDRIVDKV